MVRRLRRRDRTLVDVRVGRRRGVHPSEFVVLRPDPRAFGGDGARVFARVASRRSRRRSPTPPTYFVGEVSGIKYLVVRGEDGVLARRPRAETSRDGGAPRPARAPARAVDARVESTSCCGCGVGARARSPKRRHHGKNRGVFEGVRRARRPRATAKCFSCPYHGWTYDLEGALRGVGARRGWRTRSVARALT